MRALWALVAPLLLLCLASGRPVAAQRRPNVLFIIADDAGNHFGQASRCSWVKTPNIDRLAARGLVFENAYTPTSKCAPARAAILTGRNPWQLEEAANHQPYFPLQYRAFSEALVEAGVACGGFGKTWGPGEALTQQGAPRDFGLTRPVLPRQERGPGPALAAFLKSRPAGRPFFFWFGSANPHRPYAAGSGLASGKRLSDVPRVPGYWPDNDVVRGDMLDYATEIETFDGEVAALLAALESAGETGNTVVIVTSDHGMPFPRVKGHTYEEAHHIPFVVAGPAVSRSPGRVPQLISFIDLAPTFLELFGVDPPKSGMQPITGRSMTDLFGAGRPTPRPYLILGRERNDVQCRPGSPAGLGYPVRAIRQGEYLFVRNFKPDRWPCGDPDLGLRDTDAGPTKKLLEDRGSADPNWQHAFGKRPAEQLFNVAEDPDCLRDLAAQPEHAARVRALADAMTAELVRQQDPRVLGKGDVFDSYLSPRATGAGRRPPPATADE